MKKSVLLVEDDAAVRYSTMELIGREYDVLEAASPSEAIAHIGKPIDIALIDYMLPDMDGFELLRELRKLKPALPAIVMTAFSCESVILDALRTGVTDYIKKPFSFTYLMEKLAEALEGNKRDGKAYDAGNRKEYIMDGIAMYIEKRFREDISLDELSAVACMNRYDFSRTFRKKFGKGIKSYLNDIRVRNAAELLASSDLNISEIASFVGFKSIVNFEFAFKKAFGLSPMGHRRNLKAVNVRQVS